MFEINYPVDYVLGKVDLDYRTTGEKMAQDTILKQYNSEINYVSNYCYYNLINILNVFCDKDITNKLCSI
jgi:hypothetical protein